MKTSRLQINDPTAINFDQAVDDSCNVIANLCKKGILKEIVLFYDDEYERPVNEAFKKANVTLFNDDDLPPQK